MSSDRPTLPLAPGHRLWTFGLGFPVHVLFLLVEGGSLRLLCPPWGRALASTYGHLHQVLSGVLPVGVVPISVTTASMASRRWLGSGLCKSDTFTALLGFQGNEYNLPPAQGH